MERSQTEIHSANPLKLVDYFDETKVDLGAVKQPLIEKAGLIKDPLLVVQLFITRHQGSLGKMAGFIEELKGKVYH